MVSLIEEMKSDLVMRKTMSLLLCRLNNYFGNNIIMTKKKFLDIQEKTVEEVFKEAGFPTKTESKSKNP